MKKRPLCIICTVIVLIRCIQILCSGAEISRSSVPENLPELPAVVSVTGTVDRIEKKRKVTAVYLENNIVAADGRTTDESEILTYVSNSQMNNKIRIGNVIRADGELQLFEQARNPGNFDQRFFYLKQEIRLLLWADNIRIMSPRTDIPAQFLYRLKERWKELFIRHLGEYYGGAMNAVLLGDKSSLDTEMKTLYQKSGISHLLAISGLHMTFLGMGVYRCLRRAGLGFTLSGTAGGILLLLYSIMIGSGVSSFRALIMFMIRMGAEITGRDYDLPTALSAAAAGLCIWRPLYLADAGFQMSFGAILGMIVFAPVFSELFGCGIQEEKIREGQSGRRAAVSARCRLWLTRSLGVSLSVNLILIGPLLYFYFEIPPYSVVLNLLVIPLMPVVIGAGMAGLLLLSVLEPAGEWILQLCRIVLSGYDEVCRWSQMLPGSRVVTGKPHLYWILLYYCVLSLLYLLYRYALSRRKQDLISRGVKGGRSVRIRSEWDMACRAPGVLLVIFAAGMIIGCRTGYQREKELQVSVLDVGQGDCIYIKGPSSDFLIDGGSSDISSPGSYRIEPFLLSRAVERLDYVFVTHGDKDHINGIGEMLLNQPMGVKIGTLVLPSPGYHDRNLKNLALTALKTGTDVVVMKEDDKITDRQGKQVMTLTCLSPPENGEMPEEGNASSMVLEAEYGETRFLFPGDLEGDGEEILIKSGKLRKCNVLKAAHHGSGNSGSEPFLDLTKPDITLISAGVENRYGHPHKETLLRLEESGSSIYSTQENGTLTVRTDGRQIRVSGYME